jgi:lipopolysaccharide/colanic/teichoic acid biosynthesis glycosyltransferase
LPPVEPSHRSAMAHHVHRLKKMGPCVLISGSWYYSYGATVDDARSKLSYDLYYVKNFSVWFDLLVLLQTIRVVLWPSGVR